MRTCCKCHQEKPIEDFILNKSKLLGHEYICRECSRIRETVRAKTLKRINQVARWHQSERGKMMDKERRLLRRDKIRAKNMLNYLVEQGIIKRQPCEVCGNGNGQGHHPDYSKPLEVIWLCQTHHSEKHRELKELTYQ